MTELAPGPNDQAIEAMKSYLVEVEMELAVFSPLVEQYRQSSSEVLSETAKITMKTLEGRLNQLNRQREQLELGITLHEDKSIAGNV